MFSVRSSTEATVDYLEIAATRQVYRQGDDVELFLDSSGIVHLELILQGATVNKYLYKDNFHRLRDSICRRRPEL